MNFKLLFYLLHFEFCSFILYQSMTYDASRETEEARKKRAAKILSILKKTYPNAKIALKYTNPWELLVATILSAQCTDKKVNQVTEKLFAKYKSLDDYIVAKPQEFEQDIRSTGFYKNKAKSILTTAKLVKDQFGGRVPKTMKEMLTLAGVARKTANVVLGNAYGVVDGIAVDTHVHRISQHLRLVDMDYVRGKKNMTFKREGKEVLDYKKDADPGKIEEELMKLLPKEDWFKAAYLIIDHGRAICRAQNPDCPNCPLTHLCPASRA